MGSLFYQAKTYVCLSHPFFCFQQLCLVIAVVSFTFIPTWSRATSFIYFGFYLLYGVYFLICLLMPAYVSISFHYFHLVVICFHVSFRHTYSFFFIVCLCELSTQNVIYVDKNEDDNNSSSDWINMFVQLLACFFVDATVQNIVGTNFQLCVVCVCMRTMEEITKRANIHNMYTIRDDLNLHCLNECIHTFDLCKIVVQLLRCYWNKI